MADDKPIIIKKKGGHGGHHGGAWKVAYADFVTAMMAFFMVMWLLNSSSAPTKQAIASYFRKPGLFTEGSGTPLELGGAGILDDAFVPPKHEDAHSHARQGQDNPVPPERFPKLETVIKEKTELVPSSGGEKLGDVTGDQGFPPGPKPATDAEKAGVLPGKTDTGREQALKELMEQTLADFKAQLASSPELQELLGLVDVKLEADGLILEIMDTDQVSMFASGSARILPEAQTAFATVAGLLKKIPNKLEIVGHTDARPFGAKPGGYSNWELSADRANAARRIIEANGIDTTRIRSVVGRADRELKDEKDPLAAANRRITLKIKFDEESLKAIETPRADATARPEPTPRAAPTPRPTQRPSTPPTPIPPKELLEKSRQEKVEQLPETPPSPENPAPKGKELIFGNSPVFGPESPFFNP